MDCIANAAVYLNYYDESILEKDYFVTMFLRSLVSRHPDVIFRGGTALSKCFKVISRFSEDIDLSLNSVGNKPTQSQMRGWKRAIVDTADELSLRVVNLDKTRSRREFNLYEIEYNTCYPLYITSKIILVETSVLTKSFPTKELFASSLIYEWLKSIGASSVIEQHELHPYKLLVQSIERTFIDKVFALADYYITKDISKHSRHIYDLYKIYPMIVFNSDFRNLVSEVRTVRSLHERCVSAKNEVDLRYILRLIIDEEVYKADYEQSTLALLYEDVSYNEAITALEKIISDGFF